MGIRVLKIIGLGSAQSLPRFFRNAELKAASPGWYGLSHSITGEPFNPGNIPPWSSKMRPKISDIEAMKWIDNLKDVKREFLHHLTTLFQKPFLSWWVGVFRTNYSSNVKLSVVSHQIRCLDSQRAEVLAYPQRMI